MNWEYDDSADTSDKLRDGFDRARPQYDIREMPQERLEIVPQISEIRQPAFIPGQVPGGPASRLPELPGRQPSNKRWIN